MSPGRGRWQGLNNGISSVCLLGDDSMAEEDIGWHILVPLPPPGHPLYRSVFW